MDYNLSPLPCIKNSPRIWIVQMTVCYRCRSKFVNLNYLRFKNSLSKSRDRPWELSGQLFLFIALSLGEGRWMCPTRFRSKVGTKFEMLHILTTTFHANLLRNRRRDPHLPVFGDSCHFINECDVLLQCHIRSCRSAMSALHNL